MFDQSLKLNNKSTELESLRGLAALLVVFFHIPQWNSIFQVGLIRNSYLMVDLFFVLSGYVIHQAYSTKILSGNDLIRFQFLRFARLYPIYLFFLFFFVLIEVLKYFLQVEYGISSPNTQPFRENSIVAFVQSLFLIQAIGPTGNEATFNSPAWSISVEFYTYFVFGVIVLLFRTTKQYIFCILFVASTILLLTNYAFGFDCLLRCFSGFFLGCMTSSFVKNRFSLRVLPSYSASIVLIFTLLFLMYKHPGIYDWFILILSSSLIIVLLLANDTFFIRVLRSKPLVYLGTISYSIYMSHASVEWIINQFFRIVLKKPEVIINGKSIPMLSVSESLIACGVIILLVIAVSAFVYKYIEKPIRDKSRLYVFS